MSKFGDQMKGIILSTDLFFNFLVQIAPYDQLQMIERLVDVPQPTPAQAWYYCYIFIT